MSTPAGYDVGDGDTLEAFLQRWSLRHWRIEFDGVMWEAVGQYGPRLQANTWTALREMLEGQGQRASL